VAAADWDVLGYNRTKTDNERSDAIQWFSVNTFLIYAYEGRRLCPQVPTA
jgi:hypothetical protein